MGESPRTGNGTEPTQYEKRQIASRALPRIALKTAQKLRAFHCTGGGTNRAVAAVSPGEPIRFWTCRNSPGRRSWPPTPSMRRACNARIKRKNRKREASQAARSQVRAPRHSSRLRAHLAAPARRVGRNLEQARGVLGLPSSLRCGWEAKLPDAGMAGISSCGFGHPRRPSPLNSPRARSASASRLTVGPRQIQLWRQRISDVGKVTIEGGADSTRRPVGELLPAHGLISDAFAVSSAASAATAALAEARYPWRDHELYNHPLSILASTEQANRSELTS